MNERPHRLVMQFHAIDGMNATTISQELYHNRQNFIEEAWILFLAQFVESVHYLHVDVGILHNDITMSNILITNNDGYHIILTDFGKATKIANAKVYHLSLTEQQEYIVKYPQCHLAPEIILESANNQCTVTCIL